MGVSEYDHVVKDCSNCGGRDEHLQPSCRTCTTFMGQRVNWFPKKKGVKNIKITAIRNRRIKRDV